MSHNETKNSQEIDLSYLFKSIASFFSSIEFFIFKFIRFVIKNSIVLFFLLLLGLTIGYFLDKYSSERYKHQIVLTTNFDSATYLYKKIESIKLDKESVITGAELEPIIDVLSFVSEGWETLNIAKYLSENNMELDKYKKGNQTEQIYNYHLLTLYTNTKDLENKAVNDFLVELNQEGYFVERQAIENEFVEFEIEELERSIDHINAYFNKLGSETTSSGVNFNVEFNAQLNDLLSNKNDILKRLEKLNVLKLEQQKTFYDTFMLTNINVDSNKKIIIIPVLLIFGYLLLVFIKKRYIVFGKTIS